MLCWVRYQCWPQAKEAKALCSQAFTQPLLAIGLLDERGPALPTQHSVEELLAVRLLQTEEDLIES